MRTDRRSLATLLLTGTFAALLVTGAETTAWGQGAEKDDRVIALFDGKSLDGWTTASGEPVTVGWKVEEGVLVRAERGGPIYADVGHENFQLDFHWKIAPRGNSGVKYRVQFYEKGVFGHPGWLGCEYQLTGEAPQEKPNQSKGSAGALYALFGPNEKKQLKPVGEYNHSQIVIRGTKIEHWLNGEKIVETDTSSPQWKEQIAASKFGRVKDFALNRKGRIQLQDHGCKVWFREITLRPLDPQS
ncbi:MAG: DUF1080 domain-containing protein [Planctomycetes bacterium]|nr:DUF1080 domain-containing protein [Planctomycetota bacterium]